MYKEQVYVLKAAPAYGALAGGGVLATADQANGLAAGAIQFFQGDGTPILNAGQVTAATNTELASFFWVVGETNADGTIGVRTSKKVGRFPFEKTLTSYAAAVLQVSYLGFNTSAGSLNFPSTLIVGNTVKVGVVNRSIPYLGIDPRQTFEYTIQSGDNTVSVIAALVAGFNAQPNPIATAGVLVDGISFTAVSAGTTFQLLWDGDMNPQIDEYGFLANGTAGLSTSYHPGFGTFAFVSAQWTEASQRMGQEMGDALSLTNRFFTKPNPIEAGVNYDTYSIAESVASRGRGMGAPGNDNHRYTWFVPSGATGQAVFAAILNALILGLTNTAGITQN